MFYSDNFAKNEARRFFQGGHAAVYRFRLPFRVTIINKDRLAASAPPGFNITPTHLPGGCEDFVNFITPELQRRGRFRKEYEFPTLRENLGLKPYVNRYARARQLKAAE